MNMKHVLPALASTILAVAALSTASVAQDEVLVDLISDVDRSVAELQAELAAIDERIADDDWMVFESAAQGLVQVDLGEIRRWVPLVAALRENPDDLTGPETIGAAADVVPDLWKASLLLGDAPTNVLELGSDATIAWLRDHFADSQSPAQKRALYEAHRARLLGELDALRTTHEVFSAELIAGETAVTEDGAQAETAQAESTEVEEWCREITEHETLMTEDGSVTLGPDAPALEELPEWCRDQLLVKLLDPETPAPDAEVLAEEPVRCGEDTLEWTTDPSVEELRWNGVWEYYGEAGLTLNRVGDVVCATYGRGDGWMKLAIVDDRTLIGHWYEGEHAETCDEPRDGTVHWGWVEFRFDDTFDSYDGRLGVCDGPPLDFLQGSRAR
jgi:hypothetical protein